MESFPLTVLAVSSEVVLCFNLQPVLLCSHAASLSFKDRRRRMQSTTFGFEWPQEAWEAPPHPCIWVQSLASVPREDFHQISLCSSHCCSASRPRPQSTALCANMSFPQGWGSHHFDCMKTSNLSSLQDVQQHHPNKFCLKTFHSFIFSSFPSSGAGRHQLKGQTPIQNTNPELTATHIAEK